MKKSTKLLSLVLAGAMAFSMTGCSSNTAATTAATTTAATEAATTVAETTTAAATEAAAEGETYKIGVLQLVQHTALDASNQGFFAALDEAGIKYEADQQNASGEQANC